MDLATHKTQTAIEKEKERRERKKGKKSPSKQKTFPAYCYMETSASVSQAKVMKEKEMKHAVNDANANGNISPRLLSPTSTMHSRKQNQAVEDLQRTTYGAVKSWKSQKSKDSSGDL